MTWILAMAITFFVHPHYQSVTDIEFNSEDKIFEISITATAHDLEKILSLKSMTPVLLSNAVDSIRNADLLFDYVERNFKIRMDKSNIDFDFLGFESEKDETTIYFQSEEFEFVPEQVSIENTILMDYHNEQQNIIHFKYNNIEQHRKLTLGKSIMTIKF